MLSLYYFAVWTDSGCLLGCDHRHLTVITAAQCISHCGGYVLAIEKDEIRPLNKREEAEFQYAMSGSKQERSCVLRFPSLAPETES
jgi:hypothetical protein